MSGKPWTEEHKRKHSERMTGQQNPNFGGKSQTKETRIKISLANTGLRRTIETKTKMSESRKGENNPNYGKIRPKEVREKISASLTGRTCPPRSQEYRNKLSEALKKAYADNPNLSMAKKHPLTEETKRKISKANTGKKRSKEVIQKLIEAFKTRKPVSEETKRKISKANTGKKRSKEAIENARQGLLRAYRTRPELIANKSGPNCYLWKKEKDDRLYPLDFTRSLKRKVKERDNQQCQNPLCLHKSPFLMIHHIDFDKTNGDIDNLITLCGSCHSSTNHHVKESILFYKNIIKERFPKNKKTIRRKELHWI